MIILCADRNGGCATKVSDYSFLNDRLLPATLVNLISGIVSLKTMVQVQKDEYAGAFAFENGTNPPSSIL